MSPWGRLDDKANGNAKLLALSDAAWRMWGTALIYCQDNLTDGFVPEFAIHTFGVRARNKAPLIVELTSSLVAGKGPLWHVVDGGFQVHDYLAWNDSREVVMAGRDKSKKRKEKFLRGRVQNGVPTPSTDAFGTGDPRTTTTSSTSDDVERRTSKPNPIRNLLDRYIERYQHVVGVKPQIDGGKDAGILSNLLKQHDEATVAGALDAMFEHADDFVRSRGYGLGLFKSQFNAFLAKATKAPAGRTQMDGNYHHATCPHEPKCGTPRECNELKHAEKVAS